MLEKIYINSLELLNQINIFREKFDNKSMLAHGDLLKIIRDEFEEEIGQGKLSESSYKNKQNKLQPCFLLEINQARQILVRESKQVRKAVMTYLNTLENKNTLTNNTKELAMRTLNLIEKLDSLELQNNIQQEIIDRSNTMISMIRKSKAKEFKTINKQIKNDIGVEINFIVLHKLFTDSKLAHADKHRAAHDLYFQATGVRYLGATKSSYESKVEYLNWLKSKVGSKTSNILTK